MFLSNIFGALWARIFAGIAAVFLVGFITQTIRIEGFWFIVGFKEENAILRIDLSMVKTQRDAERQAYKDAQAVAEKLEKERLARVTAAQEEITDEIRKDYAAKLADARSRAERLRKQARSALGKTAGQPMPGVPDATGGTHAAPGDNRLSIDERLIATEQAIRLEALQDWVKQQTRVNPN